MASASTSASTLAPASASASSSAQHTQHTEYRYQLLYSKSRVTLHPTPYSRDNVPGYLALLRRQRVRQANQQGGQGSSGDAHDDGDNDGDGNDDDAAANLASSSSSSSSYAPTTPRRTAPSTATPSSAGMQRQVTLQDNCKQVLLSWFPEQLVRDRGETAKFVDVELRDAEGAMQRGETQEQELLLLHHHHQQDQSGGDEAVSVTQVVQEEATFVQPPPLSSPAELGPAQEAHRERDSPSASSDAATSSLAAPQGVSSTQSATSHEPTPTQHAFSHYLGSLYSVQVVPPTISNWYGSLRVSMRGGDTLPPLYFHDDESRSTILGVIKAGNSGTGRGGGSSTGATYPPPMNQAHVGQTPCWGGDELVQQLRKYAFVHRSVHDHRVFLLNPSPADLDIHSTPVFADNAVDRPDSRRRAAAGEPSPSSLANTSPSSRPSASSPASNRPSSDAFFPDDPFAPGYTTPYGGRRGSHAQPSVDPSGDALSTWAKSTRMSLLSRFSHITRSARTASHQILTHPAGQPYASHLPEAVQTFANAGPVGPFGAPSGEDVSDASRKAGVTEYDSARVYLAKWARLVAEEGERSKRREDLYGEAPGEVAEASLPTNEGGLGEAFQVISATAGGRNSTAMSTKRRSLQAKRRYDPISLTEWESWFDSGQDGGGVGSSGGGQGSGRPSMTFAEMKARVFSRGLAPSARRHAWPLLLGALPWDVTSDERRRYWARRTKDYEQLKSLWASSSSDSASRIRNRADVVEQRHRVRVDCLRTDRKHPMFQMGSRTDGDGGEEARERARRASAGVVGRDGQDGGGEGEGDSNKSSTVVKDGSAPSTSPLLDGLEDRGAGQGQGEDGGGRGNNTNSSSSGFPSSSTSSAASTNPHVVRLGEVLLTYTFYDTLGPDADAAWAESQRIDESELGGYVQGMSDLCAPLYVVTEGNEAETFWCFVSFMDRMRPNFLSSQAGMKTQLVQLQSLIRLCDVPLYAHLEKADCLNLFFCFRWLLVRFKREFDFEGTYRLWECCWAAEKTAGSSSEVAGRVGAIAGDLQTADVDTPTSIRDTSTTTTKTTTTTITAAAAPSTNHFHLFLCLSVLFAHRDPTMNHLSHFDEVLQYFQGLSGQMDVEEVIVGAEVAWRWALRAVADADAAVDLDPSAEATTAAPSLKGSSGAMPNATAKATATATIADLQEVKALVGL